MNTFVTSDTHFFHENIIKYENLPFENADKMNAHIINQWNSVVTPDDEVWCLGDMFFCSKEKAKEIMNQLNGHKKLVYGNHDNHGIQWFLDVGFEDVSKHPITINGYVHLQHYPPEYTKQETPEIWIYGHVHNSPDYHTIDKNTACVCISRWDFRPVRLDYIVNAIGLYRMHDPKEELSYKLALEILYKD